MNPLLALWLPLLLAALLGPLGAFALWQDARARSMAQNAGRSNLGALEQYRAWVNRTAFGHWLRQQLDAGGLTWEPGDLLAGAALAWVALNYLVRSFLNTQSWGASVVAALIVTFGGRGLLRARQGYNTKRFTEQLPDVTWMISNALRAGLSLRQGLELVAREAPRPACIFFQRLIDEIHLARPLEDVMESSATRMGSQEWSLAVTIMLIQYRAGGDLAGALEDLSRTLLERKSVQEEVASATSGARMTAVVLPFMPVVCAAVLNMAIPGVLNVLFTAWGLLLLAVFVVLQWIAYVIIRQLADIKV